MYLLYPVVAFELFLVLGMILFIDGRRSSPSIWIRNDYMLAIAANVVVTLLIFSIGGLIAMITRWSQHGVEVSYVWAIAASLVVTFLVLRRIYPKVRLAHAAALAAALPEVLSAPVVPAGKVPAAG